MSLQLYYTFDELDAMPTLLGGKYANLKIETDRVRVWLSRMTRADGAKFDHAVEIEQLIGGRWVQVADYEPLGQSAFADLRFPPED